MDIPLCQKMLFDWSIMYKHIYIYKRFIIKTKWNLRGGKCIPSANLAEGITSNPEDEIYFNRKNQVLETK